MIKPEYNTYQITLIVRDISRGEATALAMESYRLAKRSHSKSGEGRFPEDVSVIVAHVKELELGDLSA